MTIFDATYYGICLALTSLLSGVFIASVRLRFRARSAASEAFATAVMLATGGAGVALVGGVSLNALAPETGDLFYQRTHFAIFYVGFAAMLVGLTRVARVTQLVEWPRLPIQVALGLTGVLWGTFGIAVIAAAMALAVAGPTPQSAGHVPQQTIYFVPVFLAFAFCIVVPLGLAIASGPGWRRRALVWFALFASLTFVGFLREANLITSSGEPMVDLLAAFAPFSLAGLALYLNLRTVMTGVATEHAAPRA
jgi:hypothetical protein